MSVSEGQWCWTVLSTFATGGVNLSLKFLMGSQWSLGDSCHFPQETLVLIKGSSVETGNKASQPVSLRGKALYSAWHQVCPRLPDGAQHLVPTVPLLPLWLCWSCPCPTAACPSRILICLSWQLSWEQAFAFVCCKGRSPGCARGRRTRQEFRTSPLVSPNSPDCSSCVLA